MHTCPACQKSFEKVPSLYAHYRHCKKYKIFKEQQKARNAVSESPDHRGPPNSDPRDRLRELFAAQGMPYPLDPPAPKSPQEQRRTRLQDAKGHIMNEYVVGGGTVTEAMRGEAFKAIEAELSKEPLEELAWDEILHRTRGIRDQVYAPYFGQEQATQREQKRSELERQEKLLQELQDSTHKAKRRAQWIDLACSRIRLECQRRNVRSGDQLILETSMTQRLELALQGSETEQDAESIIDRVVHQHLQILDEQQKVRVEQKWAEVKDQVGDVIAALVPVGVKIAQPYINRGVNWVATYLNAEPPASSKDSSTSQKDSDRASTPTPDQAQGSSKDAPKADSSSSHSEK